MSALAGRIASSLLHGYARIAPTERGAYRLVRLGRRFIPRRNWRDQFLIPMRRRRGVIVARDQVSLELDLATYPDCMMAFGLYELDTVRVLRELLEMKRGWFVDCGANIGYFSLLASRWCHRVDAFEPDPPNRERLKMNLRANDHGGFVTVHSSAVSDRTGNFTLYHPSGGDERANHGMAGAYAGAVSDNSEEFEVRCVRLDEYIRDTPGAPLPDVIKIDVEGGELAAIRGMSGLLGVAKPPAIIVEHNPATAAAAGFTPAELFRTLVQIQPGYEIFWIGRRLRRIADPATLDAITRQGNLLARLKS